MQIILTNLFIAILDKKLYQTKINDRKDNPFFYEEIAKIIANIDIEVPCVYFDIRNYNKILRSGNKER